MKNKLAALLGAAAVFGASADAATFWADAIDWQNNGTVTNLNNRDDETNALGNPNGDFLALGLTTVDYQQTTDQSDVGFAVFSFNNASSFWAGDATVFEVTFNCSQMPGGHCSYSESLDVWYGNDYDFGTNDLSDVLDDFTFAGEILNGDAQNGETILIPGNFTYIALIDTSGTRFPNGASFDGFDVDAVGVNEVPVPGAALLMGSGLLAAAARRKRKTA
jgi:hypothetical protein